MTEQENEKHVDRTGDSDYEAEAYADTRQTAEETSRGPNSEPPQELETAPVQDRPSGEPAAYAFRWDYRTQYEREIEGRKKRAARGGMLLGLMIATVFSLFIALLALLLAVGSYRAAIQSSGSAGTISGNSSERVVYVSAGDDNEEDLAVEAAVARVLPSTASILVAKEGGGSGVGSGVVYSADGLILTNQHVVKGASAIRVRLYGGTEYGATVVAQDEQSDLALLQIDADGLTPAVFGKSEELIVGETVMTIGTPTGISFSESVSRGIVSCVRRAVKVYDQSGRLRHTLLMVQTDASVNPGNSGGAMLNRRGEVIGIVTNKSMFYENGTAYYADGMGLAIPSDAVQMIAEDLLAGETPDRSAFTIPASRLGISGQYDVTLGGVVVKAFTSDRFDAASKLRVGDVITAVNGKTLSDIDGLLFAIEDYAPGATVRLTVKRSGVALAVDLILGSDALA